LDSSPSRAGRTTREGTPRTEDRGGFPGPTGGSNPGLRRCREGPGRREGAGREVRGRSRSRSPGRPQEGGRQRPQRERRPSRPSPQAPRFEPKPSPRYPGTRSRSSSLFSIPDVPKSQLGSQGPAAWRAQPARGRERSFRDPQLRLSCSSFLLRQPKPMEFVSQPGSSRLASNSSPRTARSSERSLVAVRVDQGKPRSSRTLADALRGTQSSSFETREGRAIVVPVCAAWFSMTSDRSRSATNNLSCSTRLEPRSRSVILDTSSGRPGGHEMES